MPRRDVQIRSSSVPISEVIEPEQSSGVLNQQDSYLVTAIAVDGAIRANDEFAEV